MAAQGLWADVAVAAAAFAGTNVDNYVVTTTMVAGAPLERAHRIAAGQVTGFCVLVAVSLAGAAVLFEFSPAVVGLLGLVPLILGLRGLAGLRRGHGGHETAERRSGQVGKDGEDDQIRLPPERTGRRGLLTRRAVGQSFTAAAVVTIGAGGDNLAAYIPLFRVGGGTRLGVVSAVFVLGEVAVTALVLWAGRHPRARSVLASTGSLAVPLLLCAVGVLVLVQAGTFSLL